MLLAFHFHAWNVSVQFASFTHGALVVRTKLCNINNYEMVIILYRLLKQWSEKENFLPLGIPLLQTTFQIREWDTTLRKTIKLVMKLPHRWQTHTSNPLQNSDLVIDMQWNGVQNTRPEHSVMPRIWNKNKSVILSPLRLNIFAENANEVWTQACLHSSSAT